ncbi:phosphodiester glycosidase family protein [Paenibacillus mesophilus]|nr:phosphodiester glycosidase family protein [Paenibacillus mesophilus]
MMPVWRKSASIWTKCILIHGLLLLPLTWSSPLSATGEESDMSRVGKERFQPVAGVIHEKKTVQFETLFRFSDLRSQQSKLFEGSRVTNVLNTAAIDTGNPHVKLEIVSPAGRATGRNTLVNIAGQYDKAGHRVVAGFNLDFFYPAGMSTGFQIMGGEIMTTPDNSTTTHMAIMPDGTVKMGGPVAIRSVLTAEDGSTIVLNGVNRVREEKHTDHVFIVSDRYGASTLSKGAGVEVVISPTGSDGKVRPGMDIKGVVEAVYEKPNNKIPAGKLVLTASGTKAKWAKDHLTAGKKVSFRTDFDQGVNEAVYAMGSANQEDGRVLLRGGEVPEQILDMSDLKNVDHQPRTIVAMKGKNLHVFVFDGRQRGYSDGVSLIEAARYLQTLGMEEAINVDGGGSSTYAVRKPGDTQLTVTNRPSDGADRPLGNALLVISDEN